MFHLLGSVHNIQIEMIEISFNKYKSNGIVQSLYAQDQTF